MGGEGKEATVAERDRIGALLREAWDHGWDSAFDDLDNPGRSFGDWLAENGDEVLAIVAELAAQVRAGEAAKVRAFGARNPGLWRSAPQLCADLARRMEEGAP